MTKYLILLAFAFSQLTFASEQEALVCPLFHVSKVKRTVEERGSYDKFKHCSVSCMLALRCRAKDVMQLGVLKEFADVLGYGTPEVADMKANLTGIAFVTNKKVKTDEECMKQCESTYNGSCQ